MKTIVLLATLGPSVHLITNLPAAAIHVCACQWLVTTVAVYRERFHLPRLIKKSARLVPMSRPDKNGSYLLIKHLL
jgi:hypothetical protein